MGVFQAIKSGFTVIANNLKLWVLYIGISVVLALITIPLVIAAFGGLSVFQPGFEPSPEFWSNINWSLFIVVIIVSVILQTFINAGITGVIRDIVKTNSLNLNDFIKHGKSFFMRFLMFGLLMLGIALLFFIALMLIGTLVGLIGNAVGALGALLGIVLFIVFVVVVILLAVYGSIVPIAIVAEDKNVFESMGLGLNFIKDRLGKTVSLTLTLMVIFLLVGAINNFLSAQGGAIALLSMIVIGLINVYLSLVYPASFMSFYLGNKTG